MLLRYDPFRDFDRFTDQLFGSSGNRTPYVPMDAVRREDAVELYFDLPGVAPESIEVEVEKNVLTVKAERSWWPQEGEEALARERTHGSYTRQVLLGEALDADGVDATYEHGVLRVRVPLAERAKARKVEVKVGQQPIEVGAAS
jgi:HSP20 family protein